MIRALIDDYRFYRDISDETPRGALWIALKRGARHAVDCVARRFGRRPRLVFKKRSFR